MKNAKNIVSNLQECISIIETGTEYEQLHLGAMVESIRDMIELAQGEVEREEPNSYWAKRLGNLMDPSYHVICKNKLNNKD